MFLTSFKRTFYTLFLFFLLGGNVSASEFSLRDYHKKPDGIYDLKRIFSKYPDEKIVKYLREFVFNSRPSRLVGSKGHKSSRKHILKTIQKLGPTGEVSIEEFEPEINEAINLYERDFNRQIAGNYKKDDPVYKKWSSFTDSMITFLKSKKGLKGQNIVWEKKGLMSEKDIILIGAHYDTTAHDKKSLKVNTDVKMPGADDNASGVAILFSLIEVLNALDIPKTVRVIFFDFEEAGFLGSHAYVKKHASELKSKDLNFAGYVNLEMLGHDSSVTDKEKRHGNMRAYIRRPEKNGYQSDKVLADRLVEVGDKIRPQVDFDITPNSFNSSDHINFWRHDLPAVTFSQNWELDKNPRHHTPNDFVETLNFDTLDNSFRYITGAILAWAYDIKK